MSEFHFLRPLWLLLVPLALWITWRTASGRGGHGGWRRHVDRILQPLVLSQGESMGQRRWPLLVAAAATVIGSLALAGPSWDRLTVPAYRSDESLVVALDLSRSMDAGDIEPSRLTRARLKLLDLLERRGNGQTALVVFTANAFTVTPLTNDTRTIASLVNALSTDIMPSRGSLLEVGIRKSAELLRQAGTGGGEILLITDAIASPAAFSAAGDLEREGIRLHVLAVGTEEGAPIPTLEGGFLTDSAGNVVVPQLDFDNLQRLAQAGGGRFAGLSTSAADLDYLFPGDTVGAIVAASDDDERSAEVWRDQGIWLTLLVLPLLALGFRRGWVYAGIACLLLPLPRAEALTWTDLWKRPDQQGVEAFERGATTEAARLFENSEWRAAAQYRSGAFEASASALAGIDTAEAQYNRGNALARSGELQAAIGAYDRALELEPGHEDARFNRDLVADLLEQQQQEQQENQSDEQAGDPSESASDETQSESGQDEQQAENDPGEEGEESAESGQESEPGESPPPELADGDDQEADGNEQSELPLQAQASPQEIEDWASEQAADQWLRRVPQDPGGLLRRKFLYQYQQLGIDQDGNTIFRGGEAEPW